MSFSVNIKCMKLEILMFSCNSVKLSCVPVPVCVLMKHL